MEERKSEEFIRRSLQMATDKKLREHYFDQVNNEVSKLENDKQLFADLVNKNVN